MPSAGYVGTVYRERLRWSVSEDEVAGENGTLIVYFTYGENVPPADGVDASTSTSIQYRDDELTGNIGLVADMIANATA